MKVESIRLRVCQWVSVNRMIFHDRLRILRLGSEMIICVVSVSIDKWCCVEPTGKISVVP